MTGNDNNQTQANPIAPIQDGSVPFTPFSKPADGQNSGSINISLSPESAPIKIDTGSAKEGSQEYGYDVIRQLEQKAEQEARIKETAEKKEGKPPVSNQQPPQQTDDQKKKDEEEKKKLAEIIKVDFPKFQGHKIPEAIINDVEAIKSEAGKGDPNKAQTAVYIFLDRLLKKQAASGKWLSKFANI